MKAVIETGGKQYYVEAGNDIYVENLGIDEGKEVIFDKVLLVNGVAGHPYVPNVQVVGQVVKNGKQKKIIIFRYRPKKHSHKTQGHRQLYTKVNILRIESL